MPAYKDSDGRWRYRFAFRGKRYSGSTAKGHNTKAAAEQLERAHIEKLEGRTFTGVMPSVEAFTKQFLDFQKNNTKPLTYELHEMITRVHITPRIGRLPIDEVNRKVTDGLVSAWIGEAAKNTVNCRIGVLRRMLALAVEWELIPAVPVIKMLKVADETIRFLSDVESLQLLDAASPIWRTMILVGLRTGLRIGELRGLQWGDIDLTAGALIVRRTDPGRKDMEAGSPKGGKFRTVPLTDDTIQSLAAWRTLTASSSASATDWVFPGGGERHRSDFERGRTRSGTNCVSMMTRFVKRAGLSDCTWHTLRHTYASQLVMRGVPLRVVQELLGHASISMTERYAHLAPGFANRAVVAGLDLPLMLPDGSDTDRDVKPSNVPRGTQRPENLPQTSGSQGATKPKRTPRSTPRE
jgi:integrase